ncbi:hypothetical protein ROZALSC1DRAFT_26203, partial [Rozella allomycis CSF55]
MDRCESEQAVRSNAPENSILKFLINHGFKDPYRDLYPCTKNFTYNNTSRIDFFLTNNPLHNTVRDCAIISTNMDTDHKAIKLRMQIPIALPKYKDTDHKAIKLRMQIPIALPKYKPFEY